MIRFERKQRLKEDLRAEEKKRRAWKKRKIEDLYSKKFQA